MFFIVLHLLVLQTLTHTLTHSLTHSHTHTQLLSPSLCSGMYHLMKFARSNFLDENVRFLRESSSVEIDYHIISTQEMESTNTDPTTDATAQPPRATFMSKFQIDHSRFSFEAQVQPGNGQWLKHIKNTYILSNAPHEINLSSSLRSKILQTMNAMDQETRVVQDYTKERDIIRDVLKPARKQVMNMLTQGDAACLSLFRKTPMYQVSLEWRHRKIKCGSLTKSKSRRSSNPRVVAKVQTLMNEKSVTLNGRTQTVFD